MNTLNTAKTIKTLELGAKTLESNINMLKKMRDNFEKM